MTIGGVILFAGSALAQKPDATKFYVMENFGMGAENAETSLNKTAGLPDALSIAVQHRSRYETLDGAFRARSTGSDQIYSLRTLAQAELRLNDRFQFKAEMLDARVELVDKGTYLNSTFVNAAELLEANVQWNEDNLFADGSKSSLRTGRFTMDYGKRRFVARQRFRNTIDSYNGLDWIWHVKGENVVRTFYTLLIDRMPNQRDPMANNEAMFDKENPHRRFWGASLSNTKLPWGGKGEFYVFGLNEEDTRDVPTANRNVYTPGMRLYRTTKAGQFDYEWESVLQFGASRNSTAETDTRDLDHFAHFNHIEGGYTFAVPWSPRLKLEYDYASGDKNPRDGKNGAFDTLVRSDGR
jgi:hypothetical protein